MKKGQALIVLLVFISIAMIITTAAATVTIINTQGTGKLSQSEVALHLAEGAADNALMRIIREPNYTGEALTTPDGQVTVTVTTAGTTKTVKSEAQVANTRRIIQTTATFAANVLTNISHKEIN